MRALTVFHNEAKGFWPEHFGRKGFRHCFAAVHDGYCWIMVDCGIEGPDIQVMSTGVLNLAAFWRGEGFTVIECETRALPYLAFWPFMVGSCVGNVKRILGIWAPFVQTPHQLYRHLTKRN